MKKLIAHEVIYNRLEILVDSRGKTQFIMCRRREDQDGDTNWVLFKGSEVLAVNAYRACHKAFLLENGWAIVKELDSTSNS